LDLNIVYSIVVLALFAVLFLLRWGVRKYTEGQVSLIMLNVEKVLSTWAKEKAKSGKEKRLAAQRLIISKLYPALPAWVKLFVSDEWLIEQIDKLYVNMLDYLDDGELNDSIN